MLWGFPFLVEGQGRSPREASFLLMAMTGFVVVSALALGYLTSRFPFYRSRIVLGVVGLIMTAWTAVLVRDTPAPLWLLTVLVCAMAMGGPASMVGFDLARTFTPVEAVGRANGVVNIGGFGASLMTMALIGIVLDLRSGGGGTLGAGYDLTDYRVAMSVQYLPWLIGSIRSCAIGARRSTTCTAGTRERWRCCSAARPSSTPASPTARVCRGTHGRVDPQSAESPDLTQSAKSALSGDAFELISSRRSAGVSASISSTTDEGWLMTSGASEIGTIE